MLPLRRPLHSSPTMTLGHLTTGPSWPLEADEATRGSGALFDREHFIQQRMLCRNAHCSVGKVRPCLAVFLTHLRRPGHTYDQCPLHDCIVVHMF